ncbi:radical SAM/SPASM domain-containing protein [Halarcobacter sp.]|uniref:radical SAM/SPASM domain-containing protein n=1 Tax=Halarcobacter sp. TaxID=2321133 RepID=UPI002D1E370C|nr:radical SAM/SPASM domain-containing protein [Halarcobacter sp.]
MTNICNLKCSFCPPKILPNKTMSLDVFKNINTQLKNITKELAYHIVGDPLIISNLEKYLDISFESDLKVNITTTANNLEKGHFDTLMHQAIKQINFSINSYNANSHKKSLDEYLKPILDFLDYAINKKQHFFINLRIWNLDDSMSAKEFNRSVFEKINKKFSLNLDIEEIYKNRPKNIKIARMVFFNFDDYFEWPDLSNDFISNTGKCYGLDSHFGILSSGDVVPCCLDKDGIINLGNINNDKISDILNTKRVKDIQNGFKNGKVIEELCQKCDYRRRFD